MKKAFTLIEVNLAIMIMAGGILSILGLYGLGFRENRQSRDDVAAAAYADAVLGPLVGVLSQTNITWKTFSKIGTYPKSGSSGSGRQQSDGWYCYVNSGTGLVTSNPETKAKDAFRSLVADATKDSGTKGATWPSNVAGDMKAGLVVMHERGSAVVRLAFRATRRQEELLAMPLFYTEVRFQGVMDKADEDEETTE